MTSTELADQLVKTLKSAYPDCTCRIGFLDYEKVIGCRVYHYKNKDYRIANERPIEVLNKTFNNDEEIEDFIKSLAYPL